MKINAAICYLTQNNEVRKTHLKTSLYFLFKFFNEKFKYPVIIFHEGDYDDRSQEEIIRGVRKSCRSLVSFKKICKTDFELPSHIDKEKANSVVNIKPPPTPYWRSIRYRLMCRWWLMKFMNYVSEYDYVMRLDDDSYIEEPINKDLFRWMHDENLNYSSNMVHIDCGICCYGMKEFFQKAFENKKELVDSIFINKQIPSNTDIGSMLHNLVSIVDGKPPVFDNTINISMPLMYYNNFFITRTAFWRTEEMLKILDKIDKNGSIFYYRWGDSPLQSILLLLMSDPSKIKKASFSYSKRAQREVYHGDDGLFHEYLPSSYDKSSCITEG